LDVHSNKEIYNIEGIGNKGITSKPKAGFRDNWETDHKGAKKERRGWVVTWKIQALVFRSR